jgi:hypothetical protein
MSSTYIKEGLFYAGIGMLFGGGIGIFKAYRKNSQSNDTSQESSLSKYKGIMLDSVTTEAINQFKIYESLIPEEYDVIVDNLNKLIELQITINSGKIEARYPYQATAYVTNIQKALNSSKSKIRNTSVPHWDTDEQTIRQIADDYLFNITQDVNEHLVSSRR